MEDKRIISCLMSKKVKPNLKGFRYLYFAIKLVVENNGVLPSITKELYPQIAKAFNDIDSRVCRAIKNAIQNSSYKYKKYTNSEFISICALEVMDLI